MPFKEPFELGPFSVDPDGRLTPISQDVPVGFSVRWRGRVVHARLRRTHDGSGHLHVQSNVGRIPSTATGRETRAASFATMRDMLREVPDTWTVRLLPDHQPRVEVTTALALPVTVTNLVTELAIFLLDLDPYLDRLDETGAGPGPMTS